MSRRIALIVPLLSLVACKGDPAPAGESTSTAAETSSSSSGDGFTGDVPFECQVIGEFYFDDGVGLGAISIDAIRSVTDGTPRYDVYIHGDQEDVTQITVGFIGEPAIDLAYAASVSMAPNKPIIGLYPAAEGAPTLIGGAVTYKQVGVETGELIDLELSLQLTNGLIRGCVAAEIVASGGG